MKHLSRLALLLSFSLPVSLGCTASDDLSSKGQLIECQVASDGTTSSCKPVAEPSGTPGTCVDHDQDGDDDPHDAEAEDDDDDASVTGDTDDDDDGIGDDDDDDDDNDGIDDDNDCDELSGGDDDDADD